MSADEPRTRPLSRRVPAIHGEAGVAVGAHAAAALFSQTADQLAVGTLVTVDALQPGPGCLDGDVHLAVFPVPTAG